MLRLKLSTPQYQSLLNEFIRWLKVLNYAKQTQKSWPIHVQEYLHFHESNHIKNISYITQDDHFQFATYLSSRQNENTKGGLSNNHINKVYTAVNAFSRFLSYHGHYTFEITPYKIKETTSKREVLTVKEIKRLYEATFYQHNTARAQRDRAMIGVYYGCGLRMSEGVNLDISDIDTDNKLLLVREGKNQKTRQVPIATKHNEDIKRYLDEGRDWFTIHFKKSPRGNLKKQDIDPEAFFLNRYGQRMQSGGFYHRLKNLLQLAHIDKSISLHNLRHSIATHLLASGMELESIKDFLGHATLESTQIYTHLLNEHDELQGMVTG